MASYEGAIKATSKSVFDYHEQLKEKLRDVRDKDGRSIYEVCGIDTDRSIRLIVTFEVAFDYQKELQGELDQMELLFDLGREEEILELPPMIGFNPIELLRDNRGAMFFYKTTSIPKGIKDLVRRYLSERSSCLAES